MPLSCLRSAITASLFAVMPTFVAAQQPIPRPAAAAKPSTRIEPRISLTGEYDDNVFLLSRSQKDDLEARSAAEVQSGRFAGMEEVSDAIVRSTAAIGFETRGLGGRDLVVEPAVAYEHYFRNSERRNLTVSVAVRQDLRRSARFRLGAAHTPDYFAKNYLADAIDRNADGSISPAERVYAAGRYSETNLEVGYRFRLRRGTRRSPLAAHVEPELGFSTRSYDAPFQVRDRRGPRAGLAVGVDAGRTEARIGYLFEALSAEAAPEVLILDEAAVGRDLNGNGTTTDLTVRTVQSVDRSRREHSLAGTLSLNPPGRIDVLLIEYEHRLRNFSSREELDVAHRGRRDNRNEMRAEIGAELWRFVRWTSGVRYAKQTSNRAGDPARVDEIDDYSRLRGYTGLRIGF